MQDFFIPLLPFFSLLVLPLFVPVFVLQTHLHFLPLLLHLSLLLSFTLVYCFTAAVFGKGSGFSTQKTADDQLSLTNIHPFRAFSHLEFVCFGPNQLKSF